MIAVKTFRINSSTSHSRCPLRNCAIELHNPANATGWSRLLHIFLSLAGHANNTQRNNKKPMRRQSGAVSRSAAAPRVQENRAANLSLLTAARISQIRRFVDDDDNRKHLCSNLCVCVRDPFALGAHTITVSNYPDGARRTDSLYLGCALRPHTKD